MNQVAHVGAATQTSDCFSPQQWSGSSPSCTFLGQWKIIAVVYERERPLRNTSTQSHDFLLLWVSGSDTGTGSVSSSQYTLLHLDAIQILYLLLRQCMLSVERNGVWECCTAARLLIEHFQVSFKLNLSSSAILSHNGLHLNSNHCALKAAHCLPTSHYVTYMQRD